jgi:hypothetical protein
LLEQVYGRDARREQQAPSKNGNIAYSFSNNIIRKVSFRSIMDVFPDDDMPEYEYYTIKCCSECLNYHFVRTWKKKKWHKHPTCCPDCQGAWM